MTTKKGKENNYSSGLLYSVKHTEYAKPPVVNDTAPMTRREVYEKIEVDVLLLFPRDKDVS